MTLLRRLAVSNPSLAVIGFLTLFVPLLPAPMDDRLWHGVRTAAVEVGTVALLWLLLVRRWSRQSRRTWLQALTSIPIRFLAVLVLWGCLSIFVTTAKAFAGQGLLQLGAGALLALTIAGDSRERLQYQVVLDALIGATLLISFSGFALYGQEHAALAVGLYHDHQLFGAVFTVLLPIMLAVSLSPVGDLRRLAAQAAFVSGLIALGLAETRSSWIGLAVGLLVFGGFCFSVRTAAPGEQAHQERQPRRNIQIACSFFVVAGAIGYFLMALPQASQVAERVRTLATTVPPGQEDSVLWRMSVWQGALQMIAQRPILGWGIGCYPLHQHAFAGVGQDVPTIGRQGPTIPDEAHDSYLQIAAEMGLPALLLWLGVLISTFVLGLRALRRFTPGGLRQRVLIGCLSALVGQAVDAAANPGWQFGEVSLFFWIALGLTIALTLGVPDAVTGSEDGIYVPDPVPVGRQAGKWILALIICTGLLWVILQTVSVLPAPKL